MKRWSYDVVVVGSGGAGSVAAARASEAGARVVVLTKDPAGCSDTKISEGIVSVQGSGSVADTPAVLAENMLAEGGGIADPVLVRRFAEASAGAYRDLLRHGLRSRSADGVKPRPMPVPLGGHDHARSVDHHHGGRTYSHALAAALGHAAQVEILEDAWLLDLLQAEDGAVVGALAYDATGGELVAIAAPSVILACGGASTLYAPDTDTMRGNTGDGYAAALRAGAALLDMEQVQFLPFAAAHPPSCRGLAVGEPLSAGPLGVLRDAQGRELMGELMVRNRAEIAAAIARAVADGRGTPRGGVWLDLTANAEGAAGDDFVAIMRSRIPGILQTVKRSMGSDAARYRAPWEVIPTAHYFMGGVAVTTDCVATRADGHPIAGLFAAGQVMGGLHGSNRLGSTSLAETMVFGGIAGASAARHATTSPARGSSAFDAALEAAAGRASSLRDADASATASADLEAMRRQLQQACRETLGAARSAEGLARAAEALEDLGRRARMARVAPTEPWNQAFVDLIELRNMLLVATCVREAAHVRPGSLGAHVRLDAPADPTPASTLTWLDAGVVRSRMLPRPARSRWTSLRHGLRRSVRVGALRALRKSPAPLRTAALVRVYRRLRAQLDLPGATR